MKNEKRKILVILSNRFSPSQPARYVELDCKSDGTILEERPLKKQPREACYDEVWRNDEGKDLLQYCTRIKRIYRHPLEKRAGASIP
ncbi:MAG: hypothetical protein M1608_16360 [Candidatus Omnitrophica bacterium]|nr:hypothetical protein [Candidatus Omnitrophota bacterium]